MTRIGKKWIGVCCGMVCACADLSGQAPVSPQRQAGRWVSFLELPHRRRAATQGLLDLGADAVPALVRGLRDPRPEILSSVVAILERLGPAAAPSLPELRRLAASEDPVRAHAGRWGIAAVQAPRLVYALDSLKNKIWELSLDGKHLASIAAPARVYDADRLPNGHYLVTLLDIGRVAEIDRNGKVLWKFDGCRKPLDADRLPNGNTLIAGGQSKRVLEVNPAGEVVWEWNGTQWPNDADRLPNGNTLVCDSPGRQIVEVNPAGQVVWKHKPKGGVVDVERLTNGNTLFVSNQLGVQEIDEGGKVVWKQPKKLYASSATRLPSGNTILGQSNGVRCVGPTGRVLWTFNGPRNVKAVHYR